MRNKAHFCKLDSVYLLTPTTLSSWKRRLLKRKQCPTGSEKPVAFSVEGSTKSCIHPSFSWLFTLSLWRHSVERQGCLAAFQGCLPPLLPKSLGNSKKYSYSSWSSWLQSGRCKDLVIPLLSWMALYCNRAKWQYLCIEFSPTSM